MLRFDFRYEDQGKEEQKEKIEKIRKETCNHNSITLITTKHLLCLMFNSNYTNV